MENSEAVVLAGMAFGDEGKGSYTDFFTSLKDAKVLVKYSGGSQASHTVTLNDGRKHKFSQLSSGMFSEGTETYITENVVVNLDNLIGEVNEFARNCGTHGTELISRVHIHEMCLLVTPYHKFINLLNECLGGNKKRGSVGTGVSEARFLSDNFNISIRFGELITSRRRLRSFYMLYDYAKDLYKEITPDVMEKMPKAVCDMLEKEAKTLLDEKMFNVIARKQYNHAIALSSCLYKSYETLFKSGKNIVFEGAQGFLIDKDYGIKPNTTLCDTTNFFPKYMLHDRNVTYYGIVKAFYSKRGRGVFPSESKILDKHFEELNKHKILWNGKVRFGWFDAVLFRYASRTSGIDKALIASLDQMTGLKELSICTSYVYSGEVDQEFKNTFEYINVGNKVVILNIIRISDNTITKYLSQCTPKFIHMSGWKTEITEIRTYNMLPGNCRKYIELLEKEIEIPIEYVSVGPTRDAKIKVKIKKRNYFTNLKRRNDQKAF